MTNRLILLKKLSQVEFYEENDKISRNIENLMTIALGILLIWSLTL